MRQLRHVADTADQAGELVATHAADHILRANHTAKASTNDAQQLVAGGLAMRVVDLLESVQIEKHHRQHAPRLASRGQLPVDTIAQEFTIGQPGKMIVQCVVTRPAPTALCTEERRTHLRQRRLRVEYRQRKPVALYPSGVHGFLQQSQRRDAIEHAIANLSSTWRDARGGAESAIGHEVGQLILDRIEEVVPVTIGDA